MTDKDFLEMREAFKFENDVDVLNTSLPLVSDDEVKVLSKWILEHPELKQQSPYELELSNRPAVGTRYEVGSDSFDPDEPWFQTYSGKRFTTLNPNPESIVIQDLARALSMQCRFTGHVSRFYSVAQHSVLVSYLCDESDRLYGLLHDSSEAYISDFSAPLKHSGKFENYKEAETKLMNAICIRFGLPLEEPASVKRADKLILATEGRDVLASKRDDWFKGTPLPLKIEPLMPAEAEKLFLDRFYELIAK